VLRWDGAADDNLMWGLRVLMATPEQWTAAGGTAAGLKLGGGAPERAAYVALAAACRAKLVTMGSSLAEDEAAAAGGAAAGRERVALQYRIRKKLILTAAVVKYDV